MLSRRAAFNRAFILDGTNSTPMCAARQIMIRHRRGDPKTRRWSQRETFALRLSRRAKQSLLAAAERKSVPALVPDAALTEAEQRLAERRVFTLGTNSWKAFVAALDAPPRRLVRLERLFREPSIFDRQNGR